MMLYVFTNDARDYILRAEAPWDLVSADLLRPFRADLVNDSYNEKQLAQAYIYKNGSFRLVYADWLVPVKITKNLEDFA